MLQYGYEAINRLIADSGFSCVFHFNTLNKNNNEFLKLFCPEKGDAGGDEPQSGGAGQARRRGRYCQ